MHNTGDCLTTVENLGVTLGRNALLRNINFSLNCGQLVAVIGRNGAGKTTLLRALLGELPHTGAVRFTRHDGTLGRLNLGYVPQRVTLDVNAPTSVFDLCMCTKSRPVFLPKREADRAQVEAQLAVFGAQELADRRLCELSGGEWQRVMLAVATTPAPDLLILDEPSTGIDVMGLRLLYENINRLKHSQDMAILMVSHDFALLRQYADRVLLLDGTIVASGTPREVFASNTFGELFGVLGGGV